MSNQITPSFERPGAESDIPLGPRRERDVVSLGSRYMGYIEANLQLSSGELYPTRLDTYAYIDAVFEQGGGLYGLPTQFTRPPVLEKSTMKEIRQQDFLVPTSVNEAIDEAARCANQVRHEQQVGFSESEAFVIFTDEILRTITSPPVGYKGSLDQLAQALSEIQDVITGLSVPLEFILESTKQTVQDD